MGGRGGFSFGGEWFGFDTGDPDIINEPGLAAPDNRRSVRDRAKDLGFTDSYGTDGIDNEVMNASLAQLQMLERKYSDTQGIADSNYSSLNGVRTRNGVLAYVANPYGDNATQTLNLAINEMEDADKFVAAVTYAVNQGHFMNADTSSRQTMIGYTIAHEYGHMVENILYQRYKDNGGTMSEHAYALKVKEQILKEARTKKDYASNYSRKNAFEFFAESFANANSGRANPYGRALDRWLSRRSELNPEPLTQQEG